MQAIIVIIIFIAVFLLVYSIFFLGGDKRSQERDVVLGRLLLSQKSRHKALHQKVGGGVLERSIGQYIDLEPLTRLLDEANVQMTIGRFLILCSGLTIVTLIPSLMLFNSLAAIVIGLGIGAGLPALYLRYRRGKREAALVEQLPEAGDMILRALRAGQGLDAALNEVARTFPPPIGSELGRVYEEMAMGVSFEQAIRGFESRFHRSSDVKILCAALLIQRETGGNLTTILDNMVHTIRQRLTFFRQVKALSAEGKASAYILGLLPVVFALVTWLGRPSYIMLLFTQTAGKKVLLAAVLLELVGFALLYRFSRIKI